MNPHNCDVEAKQQKLDERAERYENRVPYTIEYKEDGVTVKCYWVGEGDNDVTKVRYGNDEQCTRKTLGTITEKRKHCPSRIEIYDDNYCGIKAAHICSLAPQ